MSLKAKIEAVVYASEEPVTLAQLVSLFTEDLRTFQQGDTPRATSDNDLQAAQMPEAEPPLAAAADGYIDERPNHPRKDSPNDIDGDELPPPASIDEGATGAEAPLDPETGEPALSASSTEAGEKRAARQRDREDRDTLRGILEELIAEYAESGRGIEIREIAGGYRFATKPECHDAVRGFVKRLKPPMKLTLQALETLAVIAYKQPVTSPEVADIRGVDSTGVLGSLMARKLITTAGRKQVIGRPILYKTTKEFLLRFGLRDVAELPSMEEFEKMAGELAETDEAIESGDEDRVESRFGRDGELPFSDEGGQMDVLDTTAIQNPLVDSPQTIESSETVPATPSHPQAQSSPPPYLLEKTLQLDRP